MHDSETTQNNIDPISDTPQEAIVQTDGVLNDYEQRLKEADDKRAMEADIKLAQLEADYPTEQVLLDLEASRAKDLASKRLKELVEYSAKKEDERSFLIGKPTPWSDIIEEENKRDWLWENYIAKGYITLLAALWKAGKSTILRCLFLAMQSEEEFGGQPTKKCKILVLSEESSGEWFDQKEDIDLDSIKQVLIWSRPIRVKPNLKQWVELVEEVTQICVKEKIDMVVVDTLTTFWPIDNENDSAQVIKALVPLYNFTENNIAVMLVHHFRKGGGDQAQASRGSGALPSFVDNIIEFTRKDDGMYTQRVLKTYGRFNDVIPQVVLEMTPDGKYKTLGEPWQISKMARMLKILEILSVVKLPMCVKDIHNVWVAQKTMDGNINITLRSIQRYLKELVYQKMLSSVETRLVGKKEIQYYALTSNWQELATIAYPLAMTPVVSSVFSDDSPLDTLSSVPPEIVRVTDDTTGISAIVEGQELDRALEEIDKL